MSAKRADKGSEGDFAERCAFTARVLLAIRDDMENARDAAERVRVQVEALMREHGVTPAKAPA